MKLISVGLTLRRRCCCSFGYCRRRRRSRVFLARGGVVIWIPRFEREEEGETVIKRNKGGGELRAAVAVGGRRKRTTPSHKSTPFIFPLDPLFSLSLSLSLFPLSLSLSGKKDFEFPKPPRLIGEQNGKEKRFSPRPIKLCRVVGFFPHTHANSLSVSRIRHRKGGGKKQWWPRGGKTG